MNLLLNPAKIEMLHYKPRIYALREVLSNVQMDRIEELGKQKVWNYLSQFFLEYDCWTKCRFGIVPVIQGQITPVPLYL